MKPMIKHLWDDKIEVGLSADEELIAWTVGKARNDRAEALGRDSEYRMPAAEGDMPPELLHPHGVGGEVATGKGLGIYPTSLGQYYGNDEDVGGIQVRCRTKTDYELYLWKDKKDSEDVPWVLTTGVLPGPYTLHGWIWGYEAKWEGYWTPARIPFPRRSCFVVPTHHLSQDWETLIQWANDYRNNSDRTGIG